MNNSPTPTLSGLLWDLGETVMSDQLDGRTVEYETLEALRAYLKQFDLTNAELALLSAAWKLVYDPQHQDDSVLSRALLYGVYGYADAFRHASTLDRLVDLGILLFDGPGLTYLHNVSMCFSDTFVDGVNKADIDGTPPPLITYQHTEEHCAEFVNLGKILRDGADDRRERRDPQLLVAAMIAKERRSDPTPLTTLMHDAGLNTQERMALACIAYAEYSAEPISAEMVHERIGIGRFRSRDLDRDSVCRRLEQKGFVHFLENSALQMNVTPVVLAEHVRNLLNITEPTEQALLSALTRNSSDLYVHHPKDGLDAVIVEDNVAKQLRLAVLRFQKDVHSTLSAWGIKPTGYTVEGKGRLVMLLYGPPGTGKTMSAYAIAKELDRSVVTIDASSFLDMYVGNSEQKLRKIFVKYRYLCNRMRKPPVFVINEADAVLNQRISVRQAADQMANNIVAILLEEIERLQGIMILTSNDITRMDEAFSRRIDVKVEMLRPSRDVRLRLWQQFMPQVLLEGTNVDLTDLADRYDLSGSEILSIITGFATEIALDDSVLSSVSQERLDEYIRSSDSGFAAAGARQSSIGFLAI